jgi:hypothetical protein
MLYVCISHECAPLALLAHRSSYARRVLTGVLLTGVLLTGVLLTGVLACTAGAQEFISAIDNPAFVQSVLSNLPGVDATDPKVLERLKKLRVRVRKPAAFRPPVLVDPSYDPARSGGRVEYAELQRAHARACTCTTRKHAHAHMHAHARVTRLHMRRAPASKPTEQ